MTSAAIITITVIITLIVAILYAWYIALRPFPAGLTWLSVVIGCSLTNIAISIILSTVTHDLLIAMTPWAFYALTGIPMIVGQILKDQQNIHETTSFIEETRR